MSKIICDIDLLKDADEIRKRLKEMGYSEEEINIQSGVHSLPDFKAQIDVYMYWGTPKSKKALSVTKNGIV